MRHRAQADDALITRADPATRAGLVGLVAMIDQLHAAVDTARKAWLRQEIDAMLSTPVPAILPRNVTATPHRTGGGESGTGVVTTPCRALRRAAGGKR